MGHFCRTRSLPSAIVIPRDPAENPFENHKDSKAQRKMFGIGVVVKHFVPLPAGRQVGDFVVRWSVFGGAYRTSSPKAAAHFAAGIARFETISAAFERPRSLPGKDFAQSWASIDRLNAFT